MWRFVLGLLVAGGAWGCGESGPGNRSVLDQQMFGPTAIRIHPTFTQVRALSGGTKPDGIEATLEIEDQFGEPTRAAGRVRFELYAYRKDKPDVKGERLSQPWIVPLDTREQQQAHWNSALRAYTFQLHFPQISNNEYYVLTAQFDLNGGAAAAGVVTTNPASASMPATSRAGRLFDQLIIEPQGEEKIHGKSRAPTRTPGH